MLGRVKGQLAIPLLAKGMSDADVGEEVGASRQAVHAFRTKPSTQATLQRIRDATYASLGARCAALAKKAFDKIEELVESDDDAVALRAADSLLDRVGFPRGVTHQHGGAVATVVVDMSRVPRELLDSYADGNDIIDLPAELLEEAMAAQGEQ